MLGSWTQMTSIYNIKVLKGLPGFFWAPPSDRVFGILCVLISGAEQKKYDDVPFGHRKRL